MFNNVFIWCALLQGYGSVVLNLNLGLLKCNLRRDHCFLVLISLGGDLLKMLPFLSLGAITWSKGIFDWNIAPTPMKKTQVKMRKESTYKDIAFCYWVEGERWARRKIKYCRWCPYSRCEKNKGYGVCTCITAQTFVNMWMPGRKLNRIPKQFGARLLKIFCITELFHTRWIKKFEMDSHLNLQNKIQYYDVSLMDKCTQHGNSISSGSVIYAKLDSGAKWILMVIIVMIIIRQIHDHRAQEKPVVCKGVP